MSNKIYLDFKSTDDGGLIVRINYNDPDLAGKSAVLSVERTVTVKDRRPVHGKKTLSIVQGEGGKKLPSITPLSEISYSAELPRLSVIDPVGFHEMLMAFRVERKVSQ